MKAFPSRRNLPLGEAHCICGCGRTFIRTSENPDQEYFGFHQKQAQSRRQWERVKAKRAKARQAAQ